MKDVMVKGLMVQSLSYEKISGGLWLTETSRQVPIHQVRPSFVYLSQDADFSVRMSSTESAWLSGKVER